MTVSISQVHIFVDDPEAALGFYRDGLGLSVTNEVVYDGFRWITLVSGSHPEVSVVLFETHAGRSTEDGDTIAALLAKGELSPVHFGTDDLEGLFERLAAVPGVEVLEEPAERPWGVRDGAVRDPAGNLIRIEERR